jgi:hypothetical protein
MTQVPRQGTRRPGLDDTRPVSAHVAESAPPGATQQPGSHDADAHPAASLGRARAASDGQSQLPTGAPLPTTLQEAIKSNFMLAKDLACRDPSARFNMDYELRMIAGLRDCLASRTQSTGTLEFILFFDNDPSTLKGTGTGVELRTSLAREDDAIVLECLDAYVVGSELLSCEKYGKGPKRYQGSQISLPLEDSLVYKQVRAGTYTPGYKSCDYP